MNYSIFQDPDALALALAEHFQKLLSEHQSEKPFFVALSGGSTPKRFYDALAKAPFLTEIDWKKVVFFFGDERSVPPEHSDSNYKMAHDALLQFTCATVYRMRAEDSFSETYEDSIRHEITDTHDGIPSFDLLLLGIGTDGHTASLFPGTEALQENEKLVVMNDVPQQDTRRMTFTYPLLNAAKRVWVLATGENKRHIVTGALKDNNKADEDWPILRVKPQVGELHWWLDQASAVDL